jgi:deoxycytidine triphosphate deaminase
MVLTHAELQKYFQNLSQRELETPEGSTLDLRLGEVHKLSSGQAFIEADTADGQGKRSMFETEQVMAYKEGVNEQAKLVIKPGEYYLVKTVETVSVPLDTILDVRPRSTLFRSGLLLATTLGGSGYEGGLIFGLYNAGPMPVTLEMGARICTAALLRIEGQGVAYRGQHQGGRVTSAGVEQQV